MKLRFFSIFALAAGLLLSSCAVEEVSVAEHTILAEMEIDQTRTSVTDEGGFTWAEGDRVWLHTTSGSVVGTLSSGAGTSRAKFSFDTYIGEMTGNAVYPYNSGHSLSGDSLSMVMPASYDLGSNLTNTNAAMYGVVNSKGILKFRHLAGVMRFKFKDVPAGVNKFTITLDKKINGTFSADLTADYPVIETSSASAASEKTITLNFNALTAKSDISVYVPLPIGTYNSLELGLYDDDQSVWTYSKSVTNTVSRKSLKLMPVVTLGGSVGGDIEGGVADLSANGTANSYIVSSAGSYKFSTVKGNSSESVGAVSSAEVLWETFGTDVTPNVGDLVKNVKYADGTISFDTPSAFKEGNAVIAAKDASDNILWSWHIWLTDQPEEQVYYNNAGTMMDRNLGATSATPGDVSALGLLYQWGRKDPFLGSSSISSSYEAKSTITWPSKVSSDSSNGTIAYATANPTTFITGNESNYDWYYTGSGTTSNTRWTTSTATKSIYDPCPSGWRVPDGGDNGIWSKALGSSSSFTQSSLYDSTNEGMNFSGKFGSDQTIWYPALGFRYYGDGSLYHVGSRSGYWSASPYGDRAYCLDSSSPGYVTPSSNSSRALGQSVRCIKEGTGDGSSDSGNSSISTSSAVSLTTTGTSNSYIVSQKGTYSFPTVKGNSSASVGSVESAEVLWESFGTDVTPEEGDLVSAALYRDGNIYFKTADTFKEGNAVIAAKDVSGNILWSWHIWLTDQPEEQVYKNNAGTMMDRNLGATSATPGDVGALGLLYQWGRKDPFLGSSGISSSVEAESTVAWPSAVSSDSSNGTIAYATANPTTFIGRNRNNNDWYYTGSESTDNTRWTTSDKTKSIYDPCPSGWRVPDGGVNGIWSKAGFYDTTYDSTNEGISFGISSPSKTWYPASGYRDYYNGSLFFVADHGYYWSASPCSSDAYGLFFFDTGDLNPLSGYIRASGQAVRCVKEGSQTSGGSQTPDVEQEKPLASSASDLGTDGSANSYIVTKSGTYKFKPVKGNSSTSVGSVSKVEVLWETFGTSETPSVGDLIKSVNYDSGYVVFATSSSFKEGNAVIAAKDVSGNILWSWHIWLTDQPEEQVYYNNAGTMMDRNLGATSAIPGDVGALGLLYQWGRKDPFLGSSSISSDIEAKSTVTWPSEVASSSATGTVDYAILNPTTFVAASSSSGDDWHYASRDNTLWTTSDKTKSIYDPCPAGWRVPDGGNNGIWSKALGSSLDFEVLYDSTNEGMNFSGKFSSASTIWYPASGYRYGSLVSLGGVGIYGDYWSASPYGNDAYSLYFYNGDYVYLSTYFDRARGLSVRCIKEGTGGGSSDSGNSSISTSSAVSLTTTGTSNSYIVSQKGTYSFPTVKGNSSASVGSVESAEVLWESFGTDVTPEESDLVSAALYRDGNIYFKTADTFKEGNAVIAAKDASGNILWSWHIWLTDQPEEQVYYNNAGTMMDRNLGATSATPGDVGALGLLYQWGRKDPFLGSSSISSRTLAKSTITWPSAVSSDSSNGTIAYATANPTTFIKYNNSINYDWYYTGSSTTDNTRWTTSTATKSIYDPCPSGWRVPDGGNNGIWSKAIGSSSSFVDALLYDSTNEGMNFSGKFGSASTIWYPASGSRSGYDGGLSNIGDYGHYWSASPASDDVFFLSFNYDGYVGPSAYYFRACGLSVRCVREGSAASIPSDMEAINMSEVGTANSYIVSSAGSYKFSTVKGNSSESVGAVASAEVLWETFGTDVTPSVGDLVKNVSYKNGEVTFQTADTFTRGNALIAAKDASGNILWSWHIWLTDQPEEQVYYNNAGTMMDRNLGATSATPGNIGALGLLYQWGRKDPFLGSSSISSNTIAKSTIAWPSAVSSDSSNGTIAYATANPTTFIKYNSSNYDWYYTGSSTTDNTRWTTSTATKSIYDPCPSGWRVPDGDINGVWSKARFDDKTYDSTNEGMSFSISSPSTTWYPASGYRYYGDGGLDHVGYYGDYWSASIYSSSAYYLVFNYSGNVSPSSRSNRAYGLAVRCVKE